jgi:hypothetical protein
MTSSVAIGMLSQERTANPSQGLETTTELAFVHDDSKRGSSRQTGKKLLDGNGYTAR